MKNPKVSLVAVFILAALSTTLFAEVKLPQRDLPDDLDYVQILRGWTADEAAPLNKWGKETQRLVASFYEDDNSFAKQLEILAQIEVKYLELIEISKRLPNPSTKVKIATIAGGLQRRIEIYAQLLPLNFVKGGPKILIDLANTFEAYEAAKLRKAAKALRQIVEKLPAHIAEDHRLTKLIASLNRHYLNWNFQVLVSKALFQKMGNNTQVTSGPVKDYILNAHVNGNQTTTSSSNIEFVPNGSVAQMRVHLDGYVVSSTSAVPSKAPTVTVYSGGYSTFSGYSDVFYDGRQFSYSTPQIGVQSSSVTNGVGATGLFQRVKRRKGYQEADASRPQANAIAAGKVYDSAQSKFSSTLAENLGTSNANLKKNVFDPLKEGGVYPDLYHYGTTSSHLYGRSSMRRPEELGGSEPAWQLSENDLVVSTHESLLNNAVERIGFAGQTLTNAQVNEKIQNYMKKLFPGQNLTFKQTDKEKNNPNLFIFDKEDPFRFVIRDGALNLFMRTGLKTPEKDATGTYEVRIPIYFTLEDTKLATDYGQIVASRIRGAGGNALAESAVVAEQVAKTLPEKGESNRRVLFSSEKTGMVSSGWIQSLILSEGWLALAFHDFKKVDAALYVAVDKTKPALPAAAANGKTYVTPSGIKYSFFQQIRDGDWHGPGEGWVQYYSNDNGLTGIRVSQDGRVFFFQGNALSEVK